MQEQAINRARKKFFVTVSRDDETGIFYCADSNIFGLNIEAKTMEEFLEILDDVAADLILANHYTAEEVASASPQTIASSFIVRCNDPTIPDTANAVSAE